MFKFFKKIPKYFRTNFDFFNARTPEEIEEKKLNKEKEKIQRDINDLGIQKIIKPTVIVLGTIMLASLNNLPNSSDEYYLYHAFLWLIVGSLIGLMAVGLAQATILEKKNSNRAVFAIPFMLLIGMAFFDLRLCRISPVARPWKYHLQAGKNRAYR
ncbi:hypothetical protein WH96_07100 [Kiloniella spongiae]|uniref:Uncharacterized protein n=1 Tax=Kiloniella spongiae TaxID=1489064 RepID=A0A0H2ML09_9PROT|nr:hypothetical protein [Kiloniella spongiae]KLN61397.1 hypothetical protein WH96_07100 [Kiloniella spongiae]